MRQTYSPAWLSLTLVKTNTGENESASGSPYCNELPSKRLVQGQEAMLFHASSTGIFGS